MGVAGVKAWNLVPIFRGKVLGYCLRRRHILTPPLWSIAQILVYNFQLDKLMQTLYTHGETLNCDVWFCCAHCTTIYLTREIFCRVRSSKSHVDSYCAIV